MPRSCHNMEIGPNNLATKVSTIYPQSKPTGYISFGCSKERVVFEGIPLLLIRAPTSYLNGKNLY